MKFRQAGFSLFKGPEKIEGNKNFRVVHQEGNILRTEIAVVLKEHTIYPNNGY